MNIHNLVLFADVAQVGWWKVGLLALVLIAFGLLFCAFYKSVENATLATIVKWAGYIVIVVGVVLFFAPIIVWAAKHLTEMLGL